MELSEKAGLRAGFDRTRITRGMDHLHDFIAPEVPLAVFLRFHQKIP
jgi:hypothetical protein